MCVDEGVLCAYTCVCACTCVGMTVVSPIYVAKAVCFMHLSMTSSWTVPLHAIAPIALEFGIIYNYELRQYIMCTENCSTLH